MTLQELSRYYKLQDKISQENEILVSLRSKALPSATPPDGMPHAPGVSDKTGYLGVAIADLEAHIARLKREQTEERKRVEIYIQTIDDGRIRTIFNLRFLACFTWQQIADALGWAYTEDAVKSMAYKYLKTHRDAERHDETLCHAASL